MALSNADRQKRYRERRKQEGKSPRWVQKGPKMLTAGDVARQRFEALVAEKLHDAFDDTTMWEFYTFLYKKAQEHQADYSGYASIAYQADREGAKKRNQGR